MAYQLSGSNPPQHTSNKRSSKVFQSLMHQYYLTFEGVLRTSKYWYMITSYIICTCASHSYLSRILSITSVKRYFEFQICCINFITFSTYTSTALNVKCTSSATISSIHEPHERLQEMYEFKSQQQPIYLGTLVRTLIHQPEFSSGKSSKSSLLQINQNL